MTNKNDAAREAELEDFCRRLGIDAEPYKGSLRFQQALHAKVFAEAEAARERLASDPEVWSRQNGSGSLRRAIEEGMAWRTMYLHERLAFEVGVGFEALPASRVLQGVAMAEPDCPVTTETCWYARVLRYRLKGKAEVRVRYVRVSEADCPPREGMALVLEDFEAPYIPKGRVVLAFTATYTDAEGWSTVSNPC